MSLRTPTSTNLANDHPLSQFRLLFWGNSDQIEEIHTKGALAITLRLVARFCNVFQNESEPFSIYLREEYMTLYEYLEEKSKARHRGGTIVIGSPGIGVYCSASLSNFPDWFKANLFSTFTL